jgi:hypothetical protein
MVWMRDEFQHFSRFPVNQAKQYRACEKIFMQRKSETKEEKALNNFYRVFVHV